MAIPGGATLRHLDLGPPAPGAIVWDDQGLVVDGLGPVMSWDDVPLPGRHNRQNTMAAAALAAHAGASANQVARGLVSFPGVPHRLERVGVAADVLFVNDSKATNPDAAIAALDAYDRGVHLIVGGRGKGTSFDALAAAARAGVVRAYLIGEAGPEVGEAFAQAGVATRECRTLERALAEAAAAARPGETVLLAPACASFDQFSGFEERGEAFRAAARGVGAR
jgi:UDP-N-acetylmuramoylalanine--D-glutamate ligase